VKASVGAMMASGGLDARVAWMISSKTKTRRLRPPIFLTFYLRHGIYRAYKFLSNIFFNLHYIQYVLYYWCKEFDMRDFMTLGPVPFEEECIQVSPEVDYTEMRNEVVKFVNLLQERFVNIPENAYFSIKRESHDFGTYFEAAVYWDTEDTDSQTFAFFVESNLPAHWSDDAKLDWSAEYVTAGE
jgi:hypothetical protein